MGKPTRRETKRDRQNLYKLTNNEIINHDILYRGIFIFSNAQKLFFLCVLLLCPKFRKIYFFGRSWRGSLEKFIYKFNSPPVQNNETLKISHFLARFIELYYKAIQLH